MEKGQLVCLEIKWGCFYGDQGSVKVLMFASRIHTGTLARTSGTIKWIHCYVHFFLLQIPTPQSDTTSSLTFHLSRSTLAPSKALSPTNQVYQQTWTLRTSLWNKNTPMWKLWLQEYPSDILYPFPPGPHTTWWHLYEAWQSGRQSGEDGWLLDTLETLCLSRVTQTGNRLSLTIVTFVYFSNKSSTCNFILLSVIWIIKSIKDMVQRLHHVI